MIPNADELLNKDFPLKLRSQFVPVIKNAYILADSIAEEVHWLNWSVGHDLKGYLRRVAVEFEIKNLIDKKGLPVGYRIGSNAIDNCRHLELVTSNFIVTINQVRKATEIPRRAIFRNNYSLSNQLCFNFWDKKVNVGKSPYYMLLTHGYNGKTPEFICLGIPEPNLTGWITRINLLKEPHQVEDIGVEKITEEKLVRFKDHVLKGVQKGETV